jgi:DNA-binding SARP family transcriptional activator
MSTGYLQGMETQLGRFRCANKGPLGAERSRGDVRLSLLNGFDLSYDGRSAPVTLTGQRLIGFLALHERPLRRIFVAGTLWSDTTEQHASANLRSALWRLRESPYDVVTSSTSHVALDADVIVDLREVSQQARSLVDPSTDASDLLLDAEALSGDLLPDWYDDWILIEQERFRQLRLHALEALCARLTFQRNFAQAIEAGLSAVAAEPLRESAYRVLIKAHLAEGNLVEAVRQFRLFKHLLRDELGMDPSREISSLVPVRG